MNWTKVIIKKNKQAQKSRPLFNEALLKMHIILLGVGNVALWYNLSLVMKSVQKKGEET